MLGTFSGGGLGMGVAFVLEDYFSKTADVIERKMGELGNYTEQMSAQINRSMDQIKMGATMTAVGVGVLAIFKNGADVRAEFQAYETRFETLLGSAERASSFFAKIKQDAKDNPIFGTESLVSANAALVATGNVAEEQSRRIVNNLAEVLSGVGGGDEELGRMAVNLQQIGNLGKATAMDIKQFGMAGVPIMKILSESTGKTVAELEGMDITLDELDKAFAHATSSGQMFYQASDRAAKSTKGLKAAMQDNIEMAWERLGAAIEPITRNIYEYLIGITDAVMGFLDSPFGQRVAQWVFYTAAFLVVGGLALLLVGGLRYGVYSLTNAFGANTKAMLIQTIATKGLSAGLREMGKAAWASLGPYALIAAAIAVFVYAASKAWDMIETGNEKMVRFGAVIFWLLGPIGWIIGMIAGIRRGFAELENFDGDKGGLIGFFMRVAGVIESIKEIWDSFNGETFTLTEELASKLEAMGILEFVIELGTWISRVKMFFMGFFDALSTGWDSISEKIMGIWDRVTGKAGQIWEKIKGIFEKLGVIFAPIVDLFGQFLEWLGFGKGALTDWGTAGSMAGNLIIGYLDMVISVIGWVIDAVLWFIDIWVSGFTMLLDAIIWIIDGIGWLYDGFIGFIDLLFGLGAMAYDVGASLMLNIWEGLKGIWESVWAWIQEKLAMAMEFITAPMKLVEKGKDFVSNLFGGDDEEKTPDGKPKPVGGPTAMPMYHAQTSKTPMVINNGGSQVSQNQTGPIILQNIMDGEVISERMMEKQELKTARE